MDYFAGLDVSVKDTSVSIVDGTGKIVREIKVVSEPGALLPILKSPAYDFKRIGLEAGPLSQWLFSSLAEADLPAHACGFGVQRTWRGSARHVGLPSTSEAAELELLDYARGRFMIVASGFGKLERRA